MYKSDFFSSILFEILETGFQKTLYLSYPWLIHISSNVGVIVQHSSAYQYSALASTSSSCTTRTIGPDHCAIASNVPGVFGCSICATYHCSCHGTIHSSIYTALCEYSVNNHEPNDYQSHVLMFIQGFVDMDSRSAFNKLMQSLYRRFYYGMLLDYDTLIPKFEIFFSHFYETLSLLHKTLRVFASKEGGLKSHSGFQ